MSKDEGLKEIVSGALWVCGGLFLTYILEYTIRIIIARLFGPSYYGLIVLTLSISVLCASLSLLGLQTGITRYAAIFSDTKEKVARVIISGLRIFLPVSVLATIVLLLNRNFLTSLVIKEQLASLVTTIFILAIPLIAVADYFYSCLRGLKLAKYAIFSREVLLRLVVLIVLIGMVVFRSHRLILVAAAYLAGYCISVVILSVWIRKFTSFSNSNYDDNFNAKELLLFSLPLLFSFILKRFSGQACNVLVGFFRNTTEVAFISTALALSNLVRFPLRLVQFMFLPVISEYWNKQKFGDLKTIFHTLSTWLFCISGFIFIVFALNARPIITMTFGEKFLPACKALIIISIGQFINTICGPTGSLLLAMGDSKKFFIADFISLLISFILYLIFIPKAGFLGAAYVNMCYLLLLNTFYLVFVYRAAKLNPFNRRIIFAIVFIALAVLFLNNYLSGLTLYARVILISIIYFAIIFATGVLKKASLGMLASYFISKFNKR